MQPSAGRPQDRPQSESTFSEAPNLGLASLELAQASLLVRLAQELPRASDELAVAARAAEELVELAGTEVAVVYASSEEGGPRLLAQRGKGLGAAWQRPPGLVHRASQTRSEQWALSADLARLAEWGVESDRACAIPLVFDGQLLGVLFITTALRAVLDRATAATVAKLLGAVLATSRRLALSADEARRDSLTGLPNKRAFRELVEALLAREPVDAPVSLVLLDIDDFKRINDTEGHPAGDRVLRQVARVILRALRADEEAFRIGGEELAVVVSGGADAAVRVAERVRAALARSTREKLPTISAGVAESCGPATSLDQLVARADGALYQAKAAGKNCVVLASGPADPDVPTSVRRPRSVLRSVALAELPHVVHSWVRAETSGVRTPAFELACRHLAASVAAAGASVSLIVGPRLLHEVTWLGSDLSPDNPLPQPVLSTPAAVPLLGAPRVLRVGRALHALADVGRLRALGAGSALIAGFHVDGRLRGSVEVYDVRSDAFSAADVYRAALATRQVAALVAQSTHAEELRSRYRTTLVSLCHVAHGRGEDPSQIDDAGLLARAVAEAAGDSVDRALACELASLVLATANGDSELCRDVVLELDRAGAAGAPASEAGRIVRLASRAAAEVCEQMRPDSSRAHHHEAAESVLVEIVLRYLALLRERESCGEGPLEALAEIVEQPVAAREPWALEALISIVDTTAPRRPAGA